MQSVDLAPDEKECLQQLFFDGPTWDGDLVSKAGRTGLVQRGYAEYCNGWQQLTSAGFNLAVRAGLGDDKERRDNRRRRENRDTRLQEAEARIAELASLLRRALPHIGRNRVSHYDDECQLSSDIDSALERT